MTDREYLLDIMCDELRDGVPWSHSYFNVQPIGGRKRKPEAQPKPEQSPTVEPIAGNPEAE